MLTINSLVFNIVLPQLDQIRSCSTCTIVDLRNRIEFVTTPLGQTNGTVTFLTSLRNLFYLLIVIRLSVQRPPQLR